MKIIKSIITFIIYKKLRQKIALNGVSNYAKYRALTQYCFLFGQIIICLSDCIAFPPLLMLQDVDRLDIVWDIYRKDSHGVMELELSTLIE